MPKLISIVASALLLAYLITEVTTRFFAGDFFALLVIATLALIANGYFVARVLGTGAKTSNDTTGSARDQGKSRNNQNRGEGRDRNKRDGNRDRNREKNTQGNRNSRNDRNQRNERGDNKSGNKKPNGGKQSETREQSGAKGAEAASPKPATPPPTPSADAETGEVKWFNRTKGHGFIIRENEEEIFVHQRAIAATGDGRRPGLRDGQKVSFVVTSNEKGVQAEQVIPLD